MTFGRRYGINRLLIHFLLLWLFLKTQGDATLRVGCTEITVARYGTKGEGDDGRTKTGYTHHWFQHTDINLYIPPSHTNSAPSLPSKLSPCQQGVNIKTAKEGVWVLTSDITSRQLAEKGSGGHP